MCEKYDAIALFSGGLDSILAVKMLEEQGLKVKCLHFCTPFFGKPELIVDWESKYNLNIDGIDVGEDFVNMLKIRPEHGFGKMLNPCVDCKILMLSKAREYMEHYGVSCVVSGEVIGQRPMSQRRDTLNVIRRDSGLSDVLLRPLSARLLNPTQSELSGLVDRELLGNISGRGRKDQLLLAERYGITDIPTPAGGCRLAEAENAARYARVLIYKENSDANDFYLAHTGRQYWSSSEKGEHWLCIGRDAPSNAKLEELIKQGDLVFKLRDFAGPLALGRQFKSWDMKTIQDAASFVASFAPRAVRSGGAVFVNICKDNEVLELEIMPSRVTQANFIEPNWPEMKKILKKERVQNS